MLFKKSCKENRKIESCSKICSTYTSSPPGDHCRNLCATPDPLCGQPEGAERMLDASCAQRAALLWSHFWSQGLLHHPCQGSLCQELPSQDGCLIKEQLFLHFPCSRETCLGLLLQGLCSGVLSSCLNKCHWGLKKGLVSQYRKTGQIEVILAHPAHLCLWNLVPWKGSGSLICSLSNWSSK